MKKYTTIQLSDVCNKEFDYLIIANTYKNPINQFINDRYIQSIKHAKVIFDLAIVNGASHNRFVSAEIKNHKLMPESIKVVNGIDESFLHITKQHFLKNKKIIDNSVIPGADKFKIMEV